MRCERVRQRRCFLIVLAVTTVGLLSPLLGVGLNTSASVPRGLYRTVPETVVRGALVVACLPTAVAVFGRARGYLSPGACPGGAQPVLKSVGAVAGDVIDVAADRVTINGVFLFARPLLRQDAIARPLPHAPLGSYRVANDEVWLFGLSHGHSWDSRYFGPVPLTAVRSVVRAVLTLGGREP